MSKHTPGPWTIERNERGTSIKAIGPLQAEEYAGSAWLDVSDVDARLIAAAPDLLAVCQELEQSASYWSEYDVPLGIVDRIKSAIAKATGEKND